MPDAELTTSSEKPLAMSASTSAFHAKSVQAAAQSRIMFQIGS